MRHTKRTILKLCSLAWEAKTIDENQNDALLMPHPTMMTPTQLNADTILGATPDELPKDVDPQSDPLFNIKKTFVSHLDLTHVSERHPERLRHIRIWFDKT